MPSSFLSKFVKSTSNLPADADAYTHRGADADANADAYAQQFPSRAQTFTASTRAESSQLDVQTPTPTFPLNRNRQPSSGSPPSTTHAHTRSATLDAGSDTSTFIMNSRHQRAFSLSAGSDGRPSIELEPTTPPQQYSVIVDSPKSSHDQVSIQQQQQQPRIPDFEPDRRSLHSAGSNNRSWRSKRSDTAASRKQSLNKREPTSGGIAGALAASGLTMANAAAGPVHQYSSPQLGPPPTSRKRPTSPSSSHSPRPSSPVPAQASSEHHNPNSPYQYSHPSSGSQIIASADESETDDTGYDSPDLDLNVDDIPVTGFAVASNKRNADFHELFPSVPEGDYLIEDYGCALQREILIQGRLYISENHVCFHANIFGWITDLVIPMYDILSLEKKMTAFVIPNALQITTRKAKYAFASFLARDTVYDVIHNVWRLARPEMSSVDGGSIRLSVDDINSSALGSNDRVVVSRERPSEDESGKHTSQKITHCGCGKSGDHYTEKVMECIVPGTPDKVYTLLFASAFMKTFMREEQKLLDIQISDWTPSNADPKLLSRNMSYIKPLSGSFGPKQTKCELRDETVHLDYEDYVSTVTATRTPDVPSGGVFTVKTRTCIMWASNNASRVIVTSQVEWTGRSFIKAVIEKSAIEGQRQYHSDLDRHLKKYINEHLTEFVPEGVVQDAQVVGEALTEARLDEIATISDLRQSPDRRGLQWAWDTFDGAYNVGKRSAKGAIELLKDTWDTSSGISLVHALVVILILSNIYTFLLVGRREEVGRRKAETRRSLERQEWIGDTVRVLLHELHNKPDNAAITHRQSRSWPTDLPEGFVKELSDLHQVLDEVEKRLTQLRDQLP